MCKVSNHLVEFDRIFPDNEAVIQYLKKVRENQGLNCRHCGKHSHSWIEKKKMWQCRSCRRRMSVKVGTCMENSNKPERDWFLVLYLITITKQSLSAISIQSILGYSRYETVWYMLQRLRKSMSSENQRQFSIYKNEECSTKKQKFEIRHDKDVFLSSKRDISLIYRRTKEPSGNDRKILITAHPQEILVGKDVKKECVENRYRYRSVAANRHLAFYPVLKKIKMSLGNIMWIEKMFFNLKCKLEGIHHLVMPYYLQLYLDEFTFRFNLRKEPKIFGKSIELLFGIRGHHCG
ncbi:MAG: hypothetical protein GC193_08725 [Cryomorphaceae bacterium]|nr:hypothetical protein [Cryomorphaceae bacterium]